MTDTSEYTPPKVWIAKPALGRFANINRPTAGAQHEKELPVGRHPLQLYSLGTPNGVKVTIMLEELLALGHKGAEYDAWLIKIGEGDQFGSGFVAINPNSKIPALVDRSGPKPIRVFETGAILVYLAEKFGAFLPTDTARARRMPVVAVLADGQHALCRRRLRPFLRLCADQDRICDRPLHDGDQAPARRARPPARAKANMSPARPTRSPTWRSSRGMAGWRRFNQYGAAEFLAVHEYKNVQRWVDALARTAGGQARAHGQPPLRRALGAVARAP